MNQRSPQRDAQAAGVSRAAIPWYDECVDFRVSHEYPMSLMDTIIQPPEDKHWRDALAAIRAGCRNGTSYWESIFGPLGAGQVDDLLVVGQIGQSLDGRAATSTGHSHYINGAEGLDHLHRLRALMDAVVDRYFPVLDALESNLEEIEEQIFKSNTARSNIEALYSLKQKLTMLKHAVDRSRQRIELVRSSAHFQTA